MSKLRIGNLDEDASIADLIELCRSEYGTPTGVVIHRGHGVSHAFINLDERSAAYALEMDGHIWRGRRLSICHANTPKRYRYKDRN
jgi:hypothetical protein